MNNLQRVLIAILAASDSPRSGYDIAKVIADKTGNSHQQIYRELRAMHDAGALICTIVPQDDKPDKKMYELIDEVADVEIDVAYFPVSDFSKINGSYQVMIRDIQHGTNHHAEYISAMQKAEMEFYNRLARDE